MVKNLSIAVLYIVVIYLCITYTVWLGTITWPVSVFLAGFYIMTGLSAPFISGICGWYAAEAIGNAFVRD
jgi:hypothetical protein